MIPYSIIQATTLTISSKGQTLMPLDWRKRHALVQDGSCNAFYLDDGALLIVPVKPPGPERLKKLLQQVRPAKPPTNWKQRVQEALKDVRG